MKSGLVSIITPAYNTEKYISKLLDSVLSQSYPSIEMIVVDDGSIDNTSSIIKSYIPKFFDKGYNLSYIYQENSGQSAAIQNAINRVTGEYLAWPDSDDYYASPLAIEKMVKRFKECGENIGMVRTQHILVKDNEDHTPIRTRGLNAKEIEDKSLFIDCLLQRNDYYYCPGDYMIKTSLLSKTSELPIFTTKDAGQNWQLMLPVLYHYQCSTILEPLYHVVERVQSHSREKKDYTKTINRIHTYETTVKETLLRIKDIPADIRDKYLLMVSIHYAKLYLKTSIYQNKPLEASQYFKYLKETGALENKILAKYILFKTGLLNIGRKLYHNFK